MWSGFSQMIFCRFPTQWRRMVQVHSAQSLCALSAISVALSAMWRCRCWSRFAVLRPSGVALADALKPAAPERRLAAYVFWLPLLLPALLAPLFGIEINSLWSMSAWTLLPVVLLSSPLIVVMRARRRKIVTVAIALPLVLLAASPFIASGINRGGVIPSAAHGRLVAERLAFAWYATTGRPLQFVGGDAVLTYAAGFYLPSGRRCFLNSMSAFRHGSIRRKSRAPALRWFVCRTIAIASK